MKRHTKGDIQRMVRVLVADDDAMTRLLACTTLENLGLEVEDLRVTYSDGIAAVNGKVPSQAEAEKVVLAVGNTKGVEQVDSRLVVEEPAPEATMYTVQSGDSLSKIAKEVYGDPMKYSAIFEANQPMLKDPDKIYPGQVLRIPVLD